ncbi:serine/threonine-protein kinase [Streptomyces sp. CA-249302]|uniref:serine/threonine-protein kinase n=1 Tax=Streptomyces sp. CA-249302 TaxID=3240058 RepID=UPI003D904409
MRGLLLDERFRIDHRLGAGGMGQVWAAEDVRMRRLVAVKVVHPPYGMDEAETQARFEREVQLAGRLTHQNIVTVHDWGETTVDGRPTLFFVMELVKGQSLDRRLKEATPAWPLAVGWAAQIAEALHAAHREGVVHRDIKPANALLTPDGTVKVLDFGIAKFMGETMSAHGLTATGTLLGSPPYMSPEQAEGIRELDHRSDLYSLGCLLYHAVTGQPPFVSGNPLAVLRMHLDDAPVEPSDMMVDGFPEALDDLILSLLAKDPENRPPDAAAVCDTLSALLVDHATMEPDENLRGLTALGHSHSASGRILRRTWEQLAETRARAEELLTVIERRKTALEREAEALGAVIQNITVPTPVDQPLWLDEENYYQVFKQSIDGSYPTPDLFRESVTAVYAVTLSPDEAQRLVNRFMNRHTAELQEDHIA